MGWLNHQPVVLGKYTMTWMISIIALIIITCVVIIVALGPGKHLGETAGKPWFLADESCFVFNIW